MMRILNRRSPWVDYLLIIVGTGLMGIGVQCLYDPMGLVTGGFTGISIILKDATQGIWKGGIPLWFTTLVLNVPVFLIAYKIKGKKFIGRTAFATFLLSAWLYVIPAIDVANGDYMIAAIFGGVISGAGMGMVLLAKTTTGGTDMVAVLVQSKLPHYSVVLLIQIIDWAVVVAGLFAFGLKKGMYAIIAIFITAKVSDALLEGLKFSKAAFIVTDYSEQIAERLMEELDRGVTGLDARGMYSNAEKCVLYCVVSTKQIVQLKDIVVSIDPRAFVIVSDAREVLGEGFIEVTP